MDNNFKKVYGELVSNFFEECSKEKIEEKVQEKHPSIFIPGVGKNYGKVQPKIVYIGIDNNGWRDLAKDINDYKMVRDNKEKLDGFLNEIINFSSECLDKQKPLNEWYSSFWEFIFKSQKKLFEKYNGNETIDEATLQTSFAWANTNSMELFHHIKNEDKNIYEYIKDKSKQFDSLKVILQALESKPDLVIILNWNEEVDYLNTKVIDEEKQDEKHLQYYKAKYNEIEVPVIWTAHPRYLGTAGGNDYYINEILNIIKEKKIF